MSALLWTALGAAAVLGGQALLRARWSFGAQRPADYAAEQPAFTPAALARGFRCEGMIHDYTGRANVRFTAAMRGAWDGAQGHLAESFRYSSGRTDERRWELRLAPDGGVIATAADIIGEARGEIAGNALMLRYRLRLPEEAGGHVLDVTDWLYLQENGAILNRSQMRKFGVLAAELFAVMIPEES